MSDTYVISPAMKLSYDKYIAPKLSETEKRLVQELAKMIAKDLGIKPPVNS